MDTVGFCTAIGLHRCLALKVPQGMHENTAAMNMMPLIAFNPRLEPCKRMNHSRQLGRRYDPEDRWLALLAGHAPGAGSCILGISSVLPVRSIIVILCFMTPAYPALPALPALQLQVVKHVVLGVCAVTCLPALGLVLVLLVPLQHLEVGLSRALLYCTPELLAARLGILSGVLGPVVPRVTLHQPQAQTLSCMCVCVCVCLCVRYMHMNACRHVLFMLVGVVSKTKKVDLCMHEQACRLNT
jgi:hypothetical protein